MKALRTETATLLAIEFAAAVAELDFERAEGWLTTAFLAAERQPR